MTFIRSAEEELLGGNGEEGGTEEREGKGQRMERERDEKKVREREKEELFTCT